MTVISVSLPNTLLHKIDQLVPAQGYSGRSELIRDAVRNLYNEVETTKDDDTPYTGTITVIYNHGQPGIDEKLTRLRHEFNALVTGNIHIHIQQKYCLEIFVTEGTQSSIMGLIGRIRSTRGIIAAKYVTVPLTD